jgi:DNA-binding response OmpR family regulator
VPESHSTAVSGSDQPSIIVLEPYDALAAAINSALRKFAPNHTRFIAESLAVAEKTSHHAELFILDVDPPSSGITNFLEKARMANPNARGLVLGAPLPPEIAAARGSFGALQFIEKPFELAVFGAAVQALLGPWQKEGNSARGTLGSLSTIDIVLLHVTAGASVVVQVRSRTRSGEIHFSRGEISQVTAGKLQGAEALWAILTAPEPHFSEAKPAAARRRGPSLDWRTTVLEILQETAPVPVELPPVEPTPAGKKIVVVDDTEMLLIFVEDILSRADPTLQITTARDATEGFAEIARVIPDIVLLDYSLPDFNGDELCERLLQNPNTANVPVLMMSGHAAEMAAAAARLPNVIATIEKPFFSEALSDLVHRTLKGERRTKAPTERSRTQPARIEIQPPRPEPPPASQKQRPVSLVESPQKVAPPAPPAIGTALVRVTSDNDAVLGLFLEVVSMQLTPQLQMGAIRAKPIAQTVSLQLSSAVRKSLPTEIGFQLGRSDLDAHGRLSTIRLTPTAAPFQPAQTRNAFEIGGVSLVPNAVKTRVQLTPAGTTPMTMELLAHLELSGVELSTTFQVAQLILRMPTNIVRVTLNPKAPEQNAAKFEIGFVKLESSGRIAELLLNPIR